MPVLRRIQAAAAVAAIVVLSTCGGDSTGPPGGGGGGGGGGLTVQVTGGTTVAIAATLQLTAQTRNAQNQAVDTAVTWQSSSSGIATVSATGLVTGVGRGAASITASIPGTSATFSHQVTVTVSSVSLTASADSLFSVGDSVTLTAQARDALGQVVPNVPFTFGTSNPAVVQVSGAPVGVAAGNGSATLTATVDGRTGSDTVAVRQVVAGVLVTPDSANVFETLTQQYTATARDARGNPVAGAAVTWNTSNMSVATVSGTGLATGQAAGLAQVFALTGGFADTAIIAVTTPTLSNHVQPIFTLNCALGGCHVGPTPQQGMNLAAGQAFTNIVNVPSNQLPAMMRIRPFLPDSSYLVHKIQGTQASVGGTGVRMPEGGAPLSPAQINLIRAWVARGAQNN